MKELNELLLQRYPYSANNDSIDESLRDLSLWLRDNPDREDADVIEKVYDEVSCMSYADAARVLNGYIEATNPNGSIQRLHSEILLQNSMDGDED